MDEAIPCLRIGLVPAHAALTTGPLLTSPNPGVVASDRTKQMLKKIIKERHGGGEDVGIAAVTDKWAGWTEGAYKRD